MGKDVTYLDCDVEEPNGHLFLKPDISKIEDVTLVSPVGVDEDKCIKCGKCVQACTYNAIAMVNEKMLFFPELCHVCGGCKVVCPADAIIEKDKKIGELKHGTSMGMDVHYALLETGEGGMSPRLIKKVKACSGNGINIRDCPPGTACPAVESVEGADLVVLITDPTPFGINDLKLAVNMCREIGVEPVVMVNRADYRDNALKEYCKEAKVDIIGEIPDDRRIAEVYSRGDMLMGNIPEYEELFKKLTQAVLDASKEKREVHPPENVEYSGEIMKPVEIQDMSGKPRPKELVIISGKGGTGKTSITACFAALAGQSGIGDCDVDAADLHLLLKPEVKTAGLFSGGVWVEIDQDKCTHCGRCHQECRFEAIDVVQENGVKKYHIDPVACEGCGVCGLVCKFDAIEMEDAVNGKWFQSETRFGPMAHAELGIAEENSGRLVTLVKEKAENAGEDKVIIDGAPGTGCPVIASISGADYALIVTEPTVSGVHDMERVMQVTKHFGVRTGVLINKCDLNQDMVERIMVLSRKYGAEIMGELPYDNESVSYTHLRAHET